MATSTRSNWTAAIELLAESGYHVERLTPFQYRINHAIDLYPTRRRYHVLKSGHRGFYREPLELVKRLL